MKPIVIITIAFVFLVPITGFAQNPQYQTESDYHSSCRLIAGGNYDFDQKKI